jgi:hypothetical protein
MIDPNELLEELRYLVQEVFDNGDDPLVLANSLAAKASELDDWLSSGGNLPEDWEGDGE